MEGMAHSAAVAAAAGEGGERVEAPGRRLAPVTGQTLREHFHLPLHSVAQRFGMCTTAFKKMCRRLGIAKWPHRQVPPAPARGSPTAARPSPGSARGRALPGRPAYCRRASPRPSEGASPTDGLPRARL